MSVRVPNTEQNDTTATFERQSEFDAFKYVRVSKRPTSTPAQKPIGYPPRWWGIVLAIAVLGLFATKNMDAKTFKELIEWTKK